MPLPVASLTSGSQVPGLGPSDQIPLAAVQLLPEWLLGVQMRNLNDSGAYQRGDHKGAGLFALVRASFAKHRHLAMNPPSRGGGGANEAGVPWEPT